MLVQNLTRRKLFNSNRTHCIFLNSKFEALCFCQFKICNVVKIQLEIMLFKKHRKCKYVVFTELSEPQRDFFECKQYFTI